MESLTINLNQLKLALNDSKTYIVEYCDYLCNQVDIATLEKEEIQMKHMANREKLLREGKVVLDS